MRKWWNKLRAIGLHLWRRGRKSEGLPEREYNEWSGGGKRPEGVPSGWELQASSEQQEITLQAIRWYGRRKLRKELKAVHRRLITERKEGALARQLQVIFPDDFPR